MAVQSSRKVPENHQDPYELERLAEELGVREGFRGSSTSVSEASERFELPVHVPLSHDNEYISAETFDVEGFLLSRAHTSLPELRGELRDYLSSLKEELVQLINDDYEDFISLSTDLRGEGARLEKIKAPLGALRQQILVCVNVSEVFLRARAERMNAGRAKELAGNSRRDSGQAGGAGKIAGREGDSDAMEEYARSPPLTRPYFISCLRYRSLSRD